MERFLNSFYQSDSSHLNLYLFANVVVDLIYRSAIGKLLWEVDNQNIETKPENWIVMVQFGLKTAELGIISIICCRTLE